MDYCKFKQDTLVKMLTLVTQSCHMVSLDLTNAYLLVTIAIAHQKLLKFEWSGQLWKWVSMPFSLTEAPRKFTKLTKPPLALIRQHGYNIANFLDDFFQAEHTYQRCYSAIQCAYTVLVGLGFLPNFNKSVLVPTQCTDALGHIIDSRCMVVYLPPTKVSCIMQLCQSAIQNPIFTIQLLCVLIGKLISCFLVLPFSKMHYRSLERLKVSALQNHRQNFEATELYTYSRVYSGPSMVVQ